MKSLPFIFSRHISCTIVLRVALLMHQWIYFKDGVGPKAIVIFELHTGFSWCVLIFEDLLPNLLSMLPISANRQVVQFRVNLRFDDGVLVMGRYGELLDLAFTGCAVHLRRYFCASAHGTSAYVSWPQPFAFQLGKYTHMNQLIDLHKSK